ncbi:hypothetical protein PDE_08875 [Penicillium oxalicum 114-2]|uniref:Uncharacterized protein n=1 Tax=Penicillium oxalicum (strain 114-2 / CGMCC 5302) TaxID=933388 RepID=S8B509_PENO1|nr:hypothetical protein PDE_08875 [Penicillium oxalicum 114-2]
MTSLSTPLPAILCGRRVEVGKPVADLLAPQFEVIHFCTGTEAALTEIPRLLQGHKPTSPDETGVGSQNYNLVPRAVVFGRGYDIAEVEQIRDAAKGCNADPVIWVTGDPDRKPGPNDPPPGPGYAQFAAEQVKKKLTEWQTEGGVKDGVVLW